MPKWPWSLSKPDKAEQFAAALSALQRAADALEATIAMLREMNRDLMEKYHALRLVGANPAPPPDPAQLVLPEPDVPPDAVLRAMKQISPTKDATYDANWMFWERNKDRAAAHPEDFAQEILQGAEIVRDVSVMWPDTKAVE